MATADFLADDRYLVHGLYSARRNVDEARERIKEKRLYGKVSVQYWDQDYLPYADNTVNLLIVENRVDVPSEEVMRVLVPLGVAFIGSKALSEKSVVGPRASGFSSDKDGEAGDIGFIVDAAGCRQAENKPLEARPTFQTEPHKGWDRVVKPWPREIDEWTHFLHGPDNNAVAQDNIVGVPRHVQWIGGPKFARSHEQLASVSAMVSARGRLFTIVDEGLTADIRMPTRWRLVARDAFNGVILWKRSIGKWYDHLHGFRSGPPDLPFRLVAVGDRVYVTLGYDKPVTALDAATGKVLMTFKGSEYTRPIIHTSEHLIMLAGTSQVRIHMNPEQRESAHRSIMAADVETGDILWRKEVSKETLLPLVVSSDA
ncbi:MAG: outer membrane protein assembly factor BamB family protein, partial [Planctomycetota bacterium]